MFNNNLCLILLLLACCGGCANDCCDGHQMPRAGIYPAHNGNHNGCCNEGFQGFIMGCLIAGMFGGCGNNCC